MKSSAFATDRRCPGIEHRSPIAGGASQYAPARTTRSRKTLPLGSGIGNPRARSEHELFGDSATLCASGPVVLQRMPECAPSTRNDGYERRRPERTALYHCGGSTSPAGCSSTAVSSCAAGAADTRSSWHSAASVGRAAPSNRRLVSIAQVFGVEIDGASALAGLLVRRTSACAGTSDSALQSRWKRKQRSRSPNEPRSRPRHRPRTRQCLLR